jgi:hypothetical protein
VYALFDDTGGQELRAGGVAAVDALGAIGRVVFTGPQGWWTVDTDRITCDKSRSVDRPNGANDVEFVTAQPATS